MILTELLETLTKIKERCRDGGNYKIVIPIQTVGSIGASPNVDVKNIHSGIDWDNGNLFIYPEKQLRVVEMDEIKSLQKTYGEYGNLVYERDNLKKENARLRKELKQLKGE
jgi:translation elongation factor EF-1alpha